MSENSIRFRKKNKKRWSDLRDWMITNWHSRANLLDISKKNPTLNYKTTTTERRRRSNTASTAELSEVFTVILLWSGSESVFGIPRGTLRTIEGWIQRSQRSSRVWRSFRWRSIYSKSQKTASVVIWLRSTCRELVSTAFPATTRSVNGVASDEWKHSKSWSRSSTTAQRYATQRSTSEFDVGETTMSWWEFPFSNFHFPFPRYRHPDDIDLWSGGISERIIEGGMIGPTFACVVGRQFQNLRRGDRYWFENPNLPSSFTPGNDYDRWKCLPSWKLTTRWTWMYFFNFINFFLFLRIEQLREIRTASQARIICANGDDIPTIQKSVLRLAHPV